MENKKIPSPETKVFINKVSFSHQEIFTVIDEFYGLIQQDPVLKVPFQSVHDWPEHISRLTHFWWLRFGGKPYLFSYYNPVIKHFAAGFNKELLQRWLMLFHKTLRKNLNSEQANLWEAFSSHMGEALNHKNELYRIEHERKKSENL